MALQYDSIAATNSLHLAKNLVAQSAHAEIRQQALRKLIQHFPEYSLSKKTLRVNADRLKFGHKNVISMLPIFHIYYKLPMTLIDIVLTW